VPHLRHDINHIYSFRLAISDFSRSEEDTVTLQSVRAEELKLLATLRRMDNNARNDLYLPFRDAN
jgi:hypothetical protein